MAGFQSSKTVEEIEIKSRIINYEISKANSIKKNCKNIFLYIKRAEQFLLVNVQTEEHDH
ncbi:unnamed protein product (macronuclear) [Paramecium tetraurelia]|uniref:Uncharacterized protein n=1 Tax=Paramecium tetraurelia TaxID=5888 RepID=A0BY13_PARTE|nr:uncharacterized protein GSPATT00033283001 [Paramecium tetraurelia]CAK63430.1 unnamed protein product [Paramecium tetraurelia]|eukprot:XP_001430828.1 hypothetical protein (macronuclear) [Paramecium tetraurelia strain d4-2]